MFYWIFSAAILISLSQQKLTMTQQELIISINIKLHIRNLIVVTDFLEKSVSLNFIKKFSKNYIFVNYQFVDGFKYDMEHNPLFIGYHPRILILFDGSNITDFLTKFFQLDTDDSTPEYTWATFHDNMSKLHDLANFYIPYSCRFLAIETVKETEFAITEYYHTRENATDTIYKSEYGKWDHNGLIEVAEMDFYQRRFNMNGTLLLIVNEFFPSVCVDSLTCLYDEIVTEIVRMMNFEAVYINIDEYNIVARNQNIADVYVGLFTFDSYTYRKEVVAPIYKTRGFFYIKHEDSYDEGFSSPYLKPFAATIWISILIWIVISGIIISIISFCHQKKIKSGSLSLTESIFVPLDSFENQCGGNNPETTSSRIATLMTCIVPAFLLPLYSAIILSFLLVQNIHLPFKNLEELIEDGSFKIGYAFERVIQIFFDRSNDPLVIHAREKFLYDMDKMPLDFVEGLRRICEDGKLAFVDFHANLADAKCKILQIPEPLYTSSDGFYLNEYSSYRVIFNKILKSFFSAGITNRQKHWIYRLEEKPEESDLEPVKFERTQQIYFIAVSLYLMSFLIFILEFLYHWLYRKLK